MYKKIIVFTFLLGWINSLSSQNYLEYYEKINLAEVYSLDGDCYLSDSIYRIAFNLVKKPFKEDYFLAAINADRIPEYEKITFEYLNNGIKKGLTLNRIKGQNFIRFKKSKYYKQIKKNYDSLHRIHIKTLNLVMRKEIEEMVFKDQKARRPIFGSFRQMKETDTYNYKRLLEIIKENNDKWPGFSLIGEITPKGKYNPSKNLAYIPLHFTKKQVENLKPYMIEAVLNGEMYPYHFARIIDYSSLKNNHSRVSDNKNNALNFCTFYGTYLDTKICNCEKAEEERKKIGLEPLDDFYRKVKSTYKCKE